MFRRESISWNWFQTSNFIIQLDGDCIRVRIGATACPALWLSRRVPTSRSTSSPWCCSRARSSAYVQPRHTPRTTLPRSSVHACTGNYEYGRKTASNGTWGRNTTACAFVAVAFASPRRDTHAQHCTNMLSRRVAIGIRARRLVLHASRSTLHAHVALALPALPSPCHARSSRSPLSLPVLSHPPTQLSLSHSSSLTPTVSPAHTLPSEL